MEMDLGDGRSCLSVYHPSIAGSDHVPISEFSKIEDELQPLPERSNAEGGIYLCAHKGAERSLSTPGTVIPHDNCAVALTSRPLPFANKSASRHQGILRSLSKCQKWYK